MMNSEEEFEGVYALYVHCSRCGDDHSPVQIQAVNIEEDPMGLDVLTFVCPVTSSVESGYVFRRA